MRLIIIIIPFVLINSMIAQYHGFYVYYSFFIKIML